MQVTVSRNFPPLTELTLVTVEDWGKIGRLARERIVRRTLSGTDQHDRAFAPYSAGYAKARSRVGDSTRPDLQVSGEMLRGITVEPDANGVTLGFTS